MRKWLVFIAIVVAVLLGAAIWFAGKADDGKPAPGEVRQEIENVL